MKYRTRRELLFITGIFFILIFSLRSLLFSHSRMFSHDTLWYYGIFHYYADSLLNGFFPFWDPYNYCGQPFYPHLTIMHLTSPVSTLIILLNRAFRMSLLTLYHWNIILHIIIVNTGVYLSLREINKRLSARVITIVTFLFSSFLYISLRQMGFIYAFLWAPYCVWFLLRAGKNVNLYNITGFAFFLGLSFSGYQGLYVLVFSAVFILPYFIKKDFIKGVSEKKNKAYLLIVLFFIAGILSLKLFSVFLDRGDFIPFARIRTSLSQAGGYTSGDGSVSSKIGDFLGLVSADIAARGYFTRDDIGFSEGFLHIGIVPLILALIGIFFGKNRFKKNFLFTLVFMPLIMLGDQTHMRGLLNFIFPPFKFVRHMMIFAGFFIFNLIYFTGIGYEYITERIRAGRKRLIFFCLVLLFISLELFLYGGKAFDYVTLPRKNVDFNEYAMPYSFIDARKDRIISDNLFRFYKGLLYREKSALNACTIPAGLADKFLGNNIYDLHSGVNFKNDFVFSARAKSSDVMDFLDFGSRNYALWDKRNRSAFIDIINVILFDLNKRFSFYSCFERFGPLYKAASTVVYLGHNRIYSAEDMVKLNHILRQMLSLDLKRVSKKPYPRFIFFGNTVNFDQMLYIHSHLYNDIPLSDYLAYVWGANHSEEFTLLMTRDYRDFLENTENFHEISDAAALEGSLIRFSPDKDSTYSIEAKNPNHIEIEYYTKSPGELYFSDGYHKYWNASMDDKKIDILKARTAFKSVKAPAGRHKIVFSYKPLFYQYSLAINYLAIILVSAYLVLANPRRTYRNL